MNRYIRLSPFAALLLMFTSGCLTCGEVSRCPGQQAPPEVLRHVVMFKFKETTTSDQVKALETAFRKLPEEIDTVLRFEWGTNVSDRNLNQDFTHCLFMTFKDQAGLDHYLPHPAHKAFVEQMKPHLDKLLVLDYLPQE